MRLSYLIWLLVFCTYCTDSVAQEFEMKTCIAEDAPSIAPYVAAAKVRLFDEISFANEYCLSKFSMTFQETRLTFARDVEFDPGKGPDEIQHGFIEFFVVFDPRTKAVLRTKEVLRP
jgi:hypothetical protein